MGCWTVMALFDLINSQLQGSNLIADKEHPKTFCNETSVCILYIRCVLLCLRSVWPAKRSSRDPKMHTNKTLSGEAQSRICLGFCNDCKISLSKMKLFWGQMPNFGFPLWAEEQKQGKNVCWSRSNEAWWGVIREIKNQSFWLMKRAPSLTLSWTQCLRIRQVWWMQLMVVIGVNQQQVCATWSQQMLFCDQKLKSSVTVITHKSIMRAGFGPKATPEGSSQPLPPQHHANYWLDDSTKKTISDKRTLKILKSVVQCIEGSTFAHPSGISCLEKGSFTNATCETCP